MKRSSILFTLILAIAVAFTVPSNAQISFKNTTDAVYLAKDSTLANSATNASQVVLVYRKGSKVSESINYLDGARVLVIGKQTNDSVHANIYVRAGFVQGAAVRTTFARILVDSLTITRSAVSIDLSAYTRFPEISIEVAGLTAGNGYVAKWTAIFGGTGKPIVAQ